MYPNVHFERRTSAPGSASTKRNYQFWAASTSSSARIASYSCPLPFARVLGGGGMKRKNALRPIENGPIGTQWPPNVPQRPFRVQNIRTRICICVKDLAHVHGVNLTHRPYSLLSCFRNDLACQKRTLQYEACLLLCTVGHKARLPRFRRFLRPIRGA